MFIAVHSLLALSRTKASCLFFLIFRVIQSIRHLMQYTSLCIRTLSIASLFYKDGWGAKKNCRSKGISDFKFSGFMYFEMWVECDAMWPNINGLYIKLLTWMTTHRRPHHWMSKWRSWWQRWGWGSCDTCHHRRSSYNSHSSLNAARVHH